MLSEKRPKTDGRELPNKDRIRTFEEKKTYKNLGILEAEIIKQVERKDKIKKSISRNQTLQQESYQRINS